MASNCTPMVRTTNGVHYRTDEDFLLYPLATEEQPLCPACREPLKLAFLRPLQAVREVLIRELSSLDRTGHCIDQEGHSSLFNFCFPQYVVLRELDSLTSCQRIACIMPIRAGIIVPLFCAVKVQLAPARGLASLFNLVPIHIAFVTEVWRVL